QPRGAGRPCGLGVACVSRHRPRWHSGAYGPSFERRDSLLHPMTLFVLPLCLVLLVAASAMAIYRLFTGPTLLDRILGFDMCAICIIGMIILLSVYWRTGVFIEILLIFSLL